MFYLINFHYEKVRNWPYPSKNKLTPQFDSTSNLRAKLAYIVVLLILYETKVCNKFIFCIAYI